MTEIQATLQIGEEIGRGHFGRVHIGNDAIRERLAIKIMEQREDEDEEYWTARKNGLIAEGSSLERANHQNIVHVHYVTHAPGGDGVHLVMEYCEGGSLESHYKMGPMLPSKVRKVGKDVSLGLASLHDRGMIHRDIKPANILLNTRGIAKVSDFGLVTDDIVDGYAEGAGYRDHLAPEYYEDRVCSIKSDIWAHGVTLYRLLHGHDWYAMQVPPRYVVSNGGFANSLKWLPHVSGEWRRVIRKMLCDNPHKRPTDMREVSRLLGAIDITDSWSCENTANQITWIRNHKARVQTVRLIRHSERVYSWESVSAPASGVGRSRKMGGENRIGYKQAEKELRAFFDSN